MPRQKTPITSTPSTANGVSNRPKHSRNTLIEARERMALEANLKVVGTPTRAFIPALAELLADLIIEKASRGDYESAGFLACGLSVIRENGRHEETGTRATSMSGETTKTGDQRQGTARGVKKVAEEGQGRRHSADDLAPQAEAR